VTIWYNLWSFGIFSQILVCSEKKTLATLVADTIAAQLIVKAIQEINLITDSASRRREKQKHENNTN
jgi:hypothetical protein